MFEPFFCAPGIELYCGDAAEVLPKLPEGSVHLTVTSPPYDNLRDYLVDKVVVWRYDIDEATKATVIEELKNNGIKPIAASK